MAAAICRPSDRKIVSVQLTFLTPDGYKVDRDNPRLTYGKMGTGAIRLGPCTNRLGLTEGTENALSAMQMTGVPCWSSAGGVRLHQLTLRPLDKLLIHLSINQNSFSVLLGNKSYKSFKVLLDCFVAHFTTSSNLLNKPTWCK